jgi:hypothetical protein
MKNMPRERKIKKKKKNFLLSIYTKCSPLGSEIYDAAIEKQFG